MLHGLSVHGPLCAPHTACTVAPCSKGVHFPGYASAVGCFFHRKNETLCEGGPYKLPINPALAKQGLYRGAYMGVLSVASFFRRMDFWKKRDWKSALLIWCIHGSRDFRGFASCGYAGGFYLRKNSALNPWWKRGIRFGSQFPKTGPRCQFWFSSIAFP